MTSWVHLSLVATFAACCGSSEALPEPFRVAVTPAPALAAPWRPLVEAELRYRNGIECGTQYLFEMADLADEAEAAGAIPALVAAIAKGPGRREATVVLALLGPDAAGVVPELVRLTARSDPVVAAAAVHAIAAMTYVSHCPGEPRIRQRRSR